MSDEYFKLGASIQHFYEVILTRLTDFETQSISTKNDLEKISYREKSVELNWLLFEYNKTFKDILYKCPHESEPNDFH